MEVQINMMAVIVAVVANFIVGFIWYTPLFGKAWATEKGFDTSVKPAAGDLAKGMIFMVIGNFLMAYVFAHNMAAWSYVPGADQMSASSNIMSASIFTWLGFYLPMDLGGVAWEKHSWKLFGINTGYHFIMVLVAAVILVYMK
ncbi:MAG TPA: DUF1761 domain-containing protein [Cyclobacteriaceae bacterium]|jgi:hypothetical protein|nr:DUF1761 domain-containing protein [Cyclobacteriaceae bacterium]